MFVLALAACETERIAAAPPVADSGGSDTVAGAVLSDRAWLTRASLDLRGVRPSPAELDAADPGAQVATWVADRRLGERIAWIWNDTLHSAVFFLDSPYRLIQPTDDEARALGWNALQVVAEIVDEDRPFTEVVTGDTVPWNDPVASFWQEDEPGTGEDWTPHTPDDGRPMAGMLSVSALWLVYDADRANYNRRRANMVARVFACADFLDRDSNFDLDIPFESLSSLSTAVRTEDTCLTCHAGLDPLAAFFGGYADRAVEAAPGDLYRYSAWTADWFRAWTPPAWAGQPGTDLADLGRLIAADPRFARCTTRRIAEGLIGHAVEENQLDEWTAAFVEDEMRVRPLVAMIVASEAYRADEERVLTTEQLHSALVDLTGYDADDSSDAGFMPLSWRREVRTLGGGTDDVEVLLRNREPGLGHHLLAAWAGGLAENAVEEDADRDADARVLWTVVDPEDVADEDVPAQLADWYTRFLGEEPGEEALAALVALWELEEEPENAGEVVIEALIRHPRTLIY